MAWSRHVHCGTIALTVLLLTHLASGLPIKQQPLISESTSILCDSIDTFTTEWFLLNTRPEYRKEIHHKALFYTRGTSKQARQLACSSKEYVTLWDIWPAWLYNDKHTPDNRLRCIHQNRSQVQTFYENMSRAYARMARKHATIMHSFKDYADPPSNGIWGRVELPTLQLSTDIYEMDKINEDRSLSNIFRIPQKPTQAVFQQAISEVQSLFRRARIVVSFAEEKVGGSCSIWNSDIDGFLDSLF